MKHSQRASAGLGRPAGNSGEIRIRSWTRSSQWRGLVIPISCVGAYDGKQARREGGTGGGGAEGGSQASAREQRAH